MFMPADDQPKSERGRVRRVRRVRRALRLIWRIVCWPFRVLWRLLLLVAALCALTVLLAAGAVYYFLHDADTKLRNVVTLTQPAKAKLPQPIRVYSADGQMIGQVAVQQRTVISGRDIPRVVREA